MDFPCLETLKARLLALGEGYHASFYMEVSWEDADIELGAAETEQHASPVDLWEPMFPFIHDGSEQKRWTPRLRFANLIELTDRDEMYRVYTSHHPARKSVFTMPSDDGHAADPMLPRPVVCYRLHARGRFQSHFELAEFPDDAQDLELEIISEFNNRDAGVTPFRSHPGTRVSVRLVKNTSPRYRSRAPPPGAFMLREEYLLAATIGAYETETDPATSSQGLTYPKLVLSLKAARRPEYYLWNVVVPEFFLVLLAMPSFFMEGDALGDRHNIVLTLLLTAVAYKQYLGDILPKCSYNTKLDQYVLFCVALIGLLGVYNGVAWLAKLPATPPSGRVPDPIHETDGLSQLSQPWPELCPADWFQLVCRGQLLAVAGWCSIHLGWVMYRIGYLKRIIGEFPAPSTEFEKLGYVRYEEHRQPGYVDRMHRL